MSRLNQFLLIASFLPLCWFAMMGVHELGHVLAAWGTGGTVTKVVLRPLVISRTDVDPNPCPLVVAWGGPAVGVGLPLVIWFAAHCVRMPGVHLVRFFAGFCFIANGAYLGVGSLSGVGDAGDLLRLGTPKIVLWVFGAITVTVGFGLWHRLGSHFGIGEARGQVEPWTAYLSLVLFVFTLLLMLFEF